MNQNALSRAPLPAFAIPENSEASEQYTRNTSIGKVWKYNTVQCSHLQIKLNSKPFNKTCNREVSNQPKALIAYK